MSDKHIPSRELKEGTAVSRYTITRQLGHGYPIDVYLAIDNNLGRQALLQFLPSDCTSKDKIKAAFNREAQAIAAISNPNLIHIYEVAEFEGRSFVAMEYSGERTLADVIREGGLSSHHALDIAIQICGGLRALHEAGIVHRDLRPAQIAIGKANQVKLLMMGHFLRGGAGLDDMAPSDIDVSEYQSPEQVIGYDIDYGSNIYSVGLILYEMFTGTHPFRGRQKPDQESDLTSSKSPDPKGKSKIPNELHLVIEKALGREIDSRYLRIDYLQEDLETARTVNSLRESEEQYRNVVERANDGICIIQNRMLKFINRRLAAMVGYSVEEGLNTPFPDYVHPDQISRVVENYNLQITGREESLRYETVLVHKDGLNVEVEINAGLITYEGHRAVLAIVRDISERKRTEKALQVSEEKYSRLFHNSIDAIIIHDLDGNIVDINNKALELFGYHKSEMLKLKLIELHPTEALQRTAQAFQDLRKNGFTNFEVDFVKKNGNIFPAEVSAGGFEVGGQKVIQAIVRDITDRRQAEENLKESRRVLATLMNNLPGMAYRCRNDTDWTMEFVSGGCQDLTGYSPKDVIDNAKISYNDIIHPDDRQRIWDEVQKSLEKGHPFKLQYRIITRENTEKWVWEQGNQVTSPEGELIALEGFITDISAYKEAEKQSTLLSSIVRQSNEGIALVGLDGNIQFINRAFAEMHGYQPEELVGKNLSIFHTADQMPAVDDANEKIRQTGEFKGEIWHVRRDNNVFPSYMHNFLLYDESGKVVGMIGTIRDITHRKKAEEDLRQAHEQLKATLNALPDLLFEVDSEGRIRDFRAPKPELLYRPPSEFIGKTFDECIPPDAAKTIKEALREVPQKGRIEGAVYSLEIQNQLYWFELSAAVKGDLNTPEGRIIILVRDISNRRRAEEALRESEEKYRRIYEDSVLGLYRTTPEGQILMVNPALLNMLGYSSSDELSLRNLEVSGYETASKRAAFKDEIEKNGIVSGWESAWIKKDGSILYVSENARAIRDNKGDIQYYEGTVEDITERKRAEEQVEKANKVIEQERNMFVSGPVVVFKWQNRPNWPVEYVSPNVFEVLGYEVDEFGTGKTPFADIIVDEDRQSVFDEVTAYAESGVDSFAHQPFRVTTKDGKIIWVSDYTTILRNKDATITHYLGYIVDITERKLAEEMLRRRTEQLNAERKALKNKNIALSQILEHIDSQKVDYQQQVYREVEQALAPFLRKLKEKSGPNFAREYQSLLDNLNAVVAKDLDEYTGRYAKLTSRESEICDLIKKGMSSKQISESLNLSVLTVLKHREQIRKKLEITNKSVNLATYLRSH